MAQTAVATQIHQPFDVHGHFSTQIALYVHLRNKRPQLIQLSLRQFTNLGGLGNIADFTQSLGLSFANAINMGERYHRMLMIWNIDSGDTRHLLSPHLLSGKPLGTPFQNTAKKGTHVNHLSTKLQESALTLLVSRI
jgi:hypothetical protein